MAEPSRVRQRLGTELRKLRTLAGQKQRPVAEALGISQTTVLRMERGEALPTQAQVKRWLTITNASDEAAENVQVLLDAAHTETRPWRDLLDKQGHLQDEAEERNAAAAVVRNFQPTVIPGLLQTAAYARAVLELGRSDVTEALPARLARQRVLHEPGRRFEFVIGEQALRWPPGPGALAGQAEQLLALATLENVDIAVLPATAPLPQVPWHNFVIREPADGEQTYVTTELIHGAQTIEDMGSIAIYIELWEHLRAAAVDGEEAAALVKRVGGDR